MEKRKTLGFCLLSQCYGGIRDKEKEAEKRKGRKEAQPKGGDGGKS